MSFVFLDTPDITGQCAMCKHHDCSKQGEKWVHFTTIETDGGYSPAIGMSCLRMLFDNAGINVEEVVHEVVRPPTEEEIGHFVRTRLFHQNKGMMFQPDEVKQVDNSDPHPVDSDSHSSDTSGSKKRKPRKGKKRTV